MLRGHEDVKHKILNYSDDILHYLQTADLARKLHIDLTVDDILNLRKEQAKKQGKTVLDLNTCIPKSKEMI
jgi:uncharacterized cupin superfamily protein